MQTTLVKALIVTLLAAPLIISPAAQAEGPDCDSNAVVYCGVSSTSDLMAVMDGGDGVHSGAELQQAIYGGGWGITADGVQSGNTVDGVVRRDGTVWVGSQQVASSAQTIGRQNMAGSAPYGNFFIRPPSVSFRSDSLPAFVNMDGGQFRWAIIKSCGNPVRATPTTRSQPTAPRAYTPVPAPAPVYTPVAPPPTPPPAAPTYIYQPAAAVAVPTTPVYQPTAAAAPPAPAPTTPRTGPGEAIGLLGGTATWQLLAAYRRSRRRLREAALNNRG